MKEPYRVEYHVIQVIYFDNDSVLTGPEFADVWSGMKIFGRKDKVVGSFWRRKGWEFTSCGEARFELGSLERVEPMLNGSEPVYGGGTSVKRNVARDTIRDCDFYFGHKDPSRWDGIDTRPEFNLAISGQWFERLGVELALGKFKEHFEIADTHCPPYGLIDIATGDDAFAGLLYGSLWIQRAPMHRWLEQGDWVFAASKKGDRARGVYWGNYFGPKILNRLGGRDDFVRRYREQATLRDGSVGAHIWEFPNGVFFSLCLDPLGCKPGEPLDFSAMFNFRWLQHELGRNGVLTAWDADDTNPFDRGLSVPATNEEMPEGESAAVAPQSSSELNDAEIQWIKGCVEQARGFVEKYQKGSGAVVLDPTALDQTFAGWLKEWKKGKTSEDPNLVVNSIGLAFGQWLVDHLGMEWSVIEDAGASDMAVVFGPPGGQVQVFPTHAVAKRLEARETGFLEPLFDAIKAQVTAVNAAGNRIGNRAIGPAPKI